MASMEESARRVELEEEELWETRVLVEEQNRMVRVKAAVAEVVSIPRQWLRMRSMVVLKREGFFTMDWSILDLRSRSKFDQNSS